MAIYLLLSVNIFADDETRQPRGVLNSPGNSLFYVKSIGSWAALLWRSADLFAKKYSRA